MCRKTRANLVNIELGKITISRIGQSSTRVNSLFGIDRFCAYKKPDTTTLSNARANLVNIELGKITISRIGQSSTRVNSLFGIDRFCAFRKPDTTALLSVSQISPAKLVYIELGKITISRIDQSSTHACHKTVPQNWSILNLAKLPYLELTKVLRTRVTKQSRKIGQY